MNVIVIVALTDLTAINLAGIGIGAAMLLRLAPQLRLAAPPKPPPPKDGEDTFLAGPPFASGDGGGS